jgi:hypothetical protein
MRNGPRLGLNAGAVIPMRQAGKLTGAKQELVQ